MQSFWYQNRQNHLCHFCTCRRHCHRWFNIWTMISKLFFHDWHRYLVLCNLSRSHSMISSLTRNIYHLTFSIVDHLCPFLMKLFFTSTKFQSIGGKICILYDLSCCCMFHAKVWPSSSSNNSAKAHDLQNQITDNLDKHTVSKILVWFLVGLGLVL